MPALPHPGPGPEVNVCLLNTHYVPQNSDKWDSRGLFQEFPVLRLETSFNLVEFELHLMFQTLQLAYSKVFPISFVCCIPLSVGWPQEWVLARNPTESTESSRRTLPFRLPLPALNKNAMSRDLAAFMQSWGKSQGNHRYQLKALLSLCCCTKSATAWLHALVLRNLSVRFSITAKSISNWYNWQKLRCTELGLTLDIDLYPGKITSNPMWGEKLPREMVERR